MMLLGGRSQGSCFQIFGTWSKVSKRTLKRVTTVRFTKISLHWAGACQCEEQPLIGSLNVLRLWDDLQLEIDESHIPWDTHCKEEIFADSRILEKESWR